MGPWRDMARPRGIVARGLAVLLVNALVLLVVMDSGASAANSLGVKRNDYNRDGVSDLVGVHYLTGCMYLFPGVANGTFAQRIIVSCGWERYHVEAVGDVNGDGNGDLVGVRISNGCIARWRGNGNGGFTQISDYGCGWDQYTELTGTGDITRDGIPDLVAVRKSDGCIARWKGNRSFGFTYIGDYGCGWEQYRNLEGPGDITSDGVGDLIALRKSDGCAATWRGTGTGGFTYDRDHLCGRPNTNVMIGLGDLNRDGNGDIAGTDLVTTSMLTWFSDGGGGFVGSGQHFFGGFGEFVLT